MDAYSWLKRSVSKLKITSLSSAVTTINSSPTVSTSNIISEVEVEKLYGINDKLIELIKSFSIQTFKDFSLPDEERHSDEGGSGNVRDDLSDWQENHATLVLSRVKELAQLRFKLCPRVLKERQFWRIYFILVGSIIAKYELRAVQLANLKQLRLENETISKGSCEVEMAEAKFTKSMDPESPVEQG